MTMATVAEQDAAASGVTRCARRRYWVLPKLQGRFIAWLVASSAVIATTVAWAVLLVVWAPLQHKLVWAGTGIEPGAFFLNLSLRVFATTGLLIMIFWLVSFLTGLVISHRIAGPLHRLGLLAEEATRGRYNGRVRLRRYDYVHDFAEQFNAMLEHFDERDRSHRRSLSRVRNELSKLESAAARGQVSPADLEKKLGETLRVFRQAETTLDS